MKRALLLLSTAGLLAGCATTTPKLVGVAYDKGDLEMVQKAKTYRWQTAKATNPYNNQGMYLDLVKSDIDAALAKKGYKLVAGKPANLELSYLVVYQTGETTAVMDKYFGTKHTPHKLIASSGGGSAAPANYEVGTIVVNAENTKDADSLWRGSVSAHIDRSKPFEAQKNRINASVALLMKEFPVAK